jgi:hypothetical protein
MDIPPPSLEWFALAPVPGAGECAGPAPAAATTEAATTEPATWFHGGEGARRIDLATGACGPGDVARLARQVLAHLLA